MVGIKQIQGMKVTAKGVRGIPAGMLVEAKIPVVIIPGIFLLNRPIAESEIVSLKPGEDVTAVVTLSDKIPVDVNFTLVKAGLLPQEDTGAPARLKQQSTVTENGGTPKTFNVDISLPTVPTTLSVRLAGGQSFWSFNQPLTESSYVFPDLAEAVNAFLDQSLSPGVKAEPPLELPFIINSTGGGKVKIGIYGVEYVRIITESWINEMDETTRLDRNLELQFGQVETIPLSSMEDASGLTLDQIRMDLGGEFGSERLLGRVEQHDGREFATISPEYSLAQGFLLDNPVQGLGVAAPLNTEAEAEIYVAIQNDDHGSPAAGAPLAQASLKLPASQTDGVAAGWVSVRFQGPAELRVKQPYWLVMKGVRGRVLLPLKSQANTYLTDTLLNRSGQLWKPFQPGRSGSRPLLRLLYQPGLDNQTAAIVMRLQGTDVRQPVEPKPAGGQTTLKPPPGAALPIVLVVESQAQGRLSLANVIQEYKSSPSK